MHLPGVERLTDVRRRIEYAAFNWTLSWSSKSLRDLGYFALQNLQLRSDRERVR
jgi:hypothetical protein